MDLTDDDLESIAAALGTDVAALQSEAVKDCAESVYAERDVSKERAFAICQAMENEGTLQAPVVTLAEQKSPGDIERVEQGDGSVRYTDIMLLAPGIWGDAGSRRNFLYSAENTIPALADNIADTTLNLFHEQDEETTDVGELDEASVYVGDDGALYGDLVLSMDNPASEFADESLQVAFDSNGQKGLKGPSLEIASTERRFNDDAGVPELMDGVVEGVGLVGLGVSPGPGSEDVAIDAGQTRDRAVALASTDDAAVLTHEDNDMSDTAQLLGKLAEDLSDEELRDLADEHDIELQEDDEEDEEPGDEMDEDEADEDGEGDDVSDDDEEDTDVDIDLTDVAERVDAMQEQVQANAERIEAIADATETLQQDEVDLADLSASVESLAESVEDYADADRVDDLETRLESIEDEPEEPTSLASMGVDANGVEADDERVLVDFGRNSVDKEY